MTMFSDPQSIADISTAIKVIDAINALGLPDRKVICAAVIRRFDILRSMFSTGHFSRELDRCRNDLGHLLYVVDFLLDVADGNHMTAAREALAQLSGMMLRTYPAAMQRGGLHGEDAILAELLPEPRGHYIEVGAWRPIEQSCTWFLYERGWSGLLVEPVPQAWEALLGTRRRDHLIKFALSDRSGLTRFWASGPTSSCRPDCRQADSTYLVVETLTMAELLADFPEIRADCGLCTIDVEGCETQVLAGFDWATFRPRVLCIEYRDPVDGTDHSADWKPLVESQGYQHVATTTNNMIFKLGNTA